MTKYNDLIPAESSSLTEKPSEVSDSQVSPGAAQGDSDLGVLPEPQPSPLPLLVHVWELCCSSSSIPAAPWHRVGLAQPWAGDVTLWGAQGAQQGWGLSLSLVATSTTLPTPQNATFVPSAVEPRGGPWHCHTQGKDTLGLSPSRRGQFPGSPPITARTGCFLGGYQPLSCGPSGARVPFEEL